MGSPQCCQYISWSQVNLASYPGPSVGGGGRTYLGMRFRSIQISGVGMGGGGARRATAPPPPPPPKYSGLIHNPLYISIMYQTYSAQVNQSNTHNLYRWHTQYAIRLPTPKLHRILAKAHIAKILCGLQPVMEMNSIGEFHTLQLSRFLVQNLLLSSFFSLCPTFFYCIFVH